MLNIENLTDLRLTLPL